LKLEEAKISDVPQMHQLINYFAEKDEMLPRSLAELYENVRDCFVVREGEEVLGCVSLHVFWSDLAEIRSLAVASGNQEKGIGAKLVKACVKEAEKLGITTIFCLTYKPAFFEGLSFSQVDKMELPRKVWTECYRCPKFPDCDEVAVVRHLKPSGLSGGAKIA
jgi:amino-acid N-acetyltransferase